MASRRAIMRALKNDDEKELARLIRVKVEHELKLILNQGKRRKARTCLRCSKTFVSLTARRCKSCTMKVMWMKRKAEAASN